MKQQEDSKTLELPLEKRGRGRPRLDGNALTPAERAKRYRDSKRLARQSSAASVTKHIAVTENENDALFWREMYESEVARVAELEARFAVEPLDGFSYAHVTKIVERQIADLMAEAARKPGDAQWWRSCAYGVYLGWHRLFAAYAPDSEIERLKALTNLS